MSWYIEERIKRPIMVIKILSTINVEAFRSFKSEISAHPLFNQTLFELYFLDPDNFFWEDSNVYSSRRYN
jgi:hypothetical protein